MGRKAVWGILGLGMAFSLAAGAATSGKKRQAELDLGVWVSNVSQRLDAPAGFASKVSSVQAAVRYRLGFAVKKWRLEPGLTVLFPWRSGADGSTKVFTSHLGLTGVFTLNRLMNLRLGTGVLWELMMASQQTLTLDNGTGTSDFYIPPRNTNTLLLTVQGGLSFALSPKWTLGTEVIVAQVVSAERRRFHALATLGVKL